MIEYDDDTLWAQRVRGLLIGLAVGDMVGRSKAPAPTGGQLRAGVSTQLAAFTVDGLIRGMVRGHHRGICHPASVLWHAYSRWAVLQDIDPDAISAQWLSGASSGWPDGWLAHVPALRERRGSAPATVSALKRLKQGSLEEPSSNSSGSHSLTRILPAAAVSRIWSEEVLVRNVREFAALTHGHPGALYAASVGTQIAASCLQGMSVSEAMHHSFGRSMLDGWEPMALLHASARAEMDPPDQVVLRQIAPTATAESALHGAIYVVHCYPDPADAMKAIAFAASAPDGSAVAAVTGALLGAAHGVAMWPVELVSRLELVWVLDTLARDLVLQLTENPGGSEHTPPRDPTWWERYPGW
jgi:ADP-ribosylglycohydrolase